MLVVVFTVQVVSLDNVAFSQEYEGSSQDRVTSVEQDVVLYGIVSVLVGQTTSLQDGFSLSMEFVCWCRSRGSLPA